jgi:hypothetical protein
MLFQNLLEIFEEVLVEGGVLGVVRLNHGTIESCHFLRFRRKVDCSA